MGFPGEFGNAQQFTGGKWRGLLQLALSVFRDLGQRDGVLDVARLVCVLRDARFQASIAQGFDRGCASGTGGLVSAHRHALAAQHSTCRSFVTISSGSCSFRAVMVLLHGQDHSSRWIRSMGLGQLHAGGGRYMRLKTGASI